MLFFPVRIIHFYIIVHCLPQTLDQRERKQAEEVNQHTQTMPPRSLVRLALEKHILELSALVNETKDDASVNSSMSSGLRTSPASLTEAWEERRLVNNGQNSEGGNEYLHLLKSHKEKLEDGMRELRRRNEALEREKEESEKDRDQLRAKLAQAQAGCVSEEASHHRSEAQHSSDSSSLAKLTEQLQATQGRYRELKEKLDSLQKSSAQRDRTEALLEQKDKDCAQLVKDCEALKAQATSLLGELNERQSALEKSEHDRKILDEMLCVKLEALQGSERELEQQKKQHNVAVDKLLLQTQSLENALKAERHVVIEERKKLTQLQHAYTCLFRDYDSKLKNEGEDMCSRLEEAERALALKQDLIDKLKEEVEQQRYTLETVPVLTAQAEIYKADFLAEREAREKLNQRKEELQDQLTRALAEIDRIKQEGASRARIEEMQQRHLEDFRPQRPTHLAPQAFNTAPPLASFRSQGLPQVGAGPGVGPGAEELPDYRCPKCQYQAPDMDTLQIHVMDCIQ
ncbi:NF-kappa-B essential modulator [Merluccius polli]|uniref:NF-kappa-B essential modulator n=1 Tax=Merluccius polli TaxID=89951 RepID=A0AA47PA88_MERPO|nr:NF-kappa-B essential modulator [Merluccius polli]